MNTNLNEIPGLPRDMAAFIESLEHEEPASGELVGADKTTLDAIVRSTDDSYGEDLDGKLGEVSKQFYAYIEKKRQEISSGLPDQPEEEGWDKAERVNDLLIQELKGDVFLKAFGAHVYRLSKEIIKKEGVEAEQARRDVSVAKMEKTLLIWKKLADDFTEFGIEDSKLAENLAMLTELIERERAEQS